MKPVSFCEIVADEGEWSYRKGANSSWLSAVFLAGSCYCTLGLSRLSCVYYRFAAVFRNGTLRSLARCRCAGGFQCVVPAVKVQWTSEVLCSHLWGGVILLLHD